MSDSDTSISSKRSRAPRIKLRLQIDDLRSSGTARFLTSIDAPALLPRCVADVCALLAGPLRHARTPEVRSVTVICDEMGGVAYTCGTKLDEAHKEIHISMPYIAAQSEERTEHEIKGVLYHEMVHVFQHNARGSCPGGLIEGIADWVRLKAGLAPPHWNDKPGECWDAGYEKTAFFLEFIAKRLDDAAFVPKLNAAMARDAWSDGAVFARVAGASVAHLWKAYLRHCSGDPEEEGASATGEKPALPTGSAPVPALAPVQQSDDR